MSLGSKDAAKLRGEARTARVKAKVRDAMETIQREINGNEGIYPRNGGTVSMNEVARVAKISETTLFTPAQKAFGQTVKAWVNSLKKKEVVGRMQVRRTFYQRAEAWREKFLALQNSHIATELELQDTKAMLEQAEEEIAKLRLEYAELLRKFALTNKPKVAATNNN